MALITKLPYSNYMGSLGPQCLDDKCGYIPFQQYCNQPAWGYKTRRGRRQHRRQCPMPRHVWPRAGAKLGMIDVVDGMFPTPSCWAKRCRHRMPTWCFTTWYTIYGTQLNSTIIPINYPHR